MKFDFRICEIQHLRLLEFRHIWISTSDFLDKQLLTYVRFNLSEPQILIYVNLNYGLFEPLHLFSVNYCFWLLWTLTSDFCELPTIWTSNYECCELKFLISANINFWGMWTSASDCNFLMVVKFNLWSLWLLRISNSDFCEPQLLTLTSYFLFCEVQFLKSVNFNLGTLLIHVNVILWLLWDSTSYFCVLQLRT